jgi:hypothetical protein
MPLGALWMGEVGQIWSIQIATFAGAAVCAAAVLLLRLKSTELHAI